MTLAWLEALKGLALVWVFLNHLSERLFGYPLIANPTAGWPPLEQRIAQLAPLHGLGTLGPLVNTLRYLGWAGDQGVGLFLVASGFGLTWGSLTARRRPFDARDFYRRRAARLYPAWWAAHLLFLAPAVAVGRIRLDDVALPLSLLGIRVAPRLLYYLVPAWWYVGCLLQLYLVFPLLLSGLRRWGPVRFAAVVGGGSVALRAAGLVLLDENVDWWARGGIALTRLPEFVVGMTLAAMVSQGPVAVRGWLRAPRTLLAAATAYALGSVLSLTLLGMAVAPLLLAGGAFIILWAALEGDGGRGLGWLGWIGRHSYALFLVHQPLVFALVPEGASGTRAIVGSTGAALLTVVLACALEGAVDYAVGLRARLRAVHLVASGSALVCGLALLVGAELVIRRIAPQEGGGWGERPSLEASTEFGWRLIPDRQTHLRWDTYDYHVTASALGFPAPAYPIERPAGVRRVLVTGDAFSSPEGVDTEAGWVRLLEPLLAKDLGQPVQVLNFAITGYGPRQYAAVVERFASIYRPDVILVESFVNDGFDALTSDDAFRESIGFGRPPAESWVSVCRLTNLRHLVRVALLEPGLEWLLGRPRAQGALLGGFEALEGRHASWETAAHAEMSAMFARIATTAAAVGARTAVVMVPAAAQVCTARDLPYWPRPFDLTDETAWDVERPQRLLHEIARDIGAPVLDLRSALRAAPACPYQPHNMHWLPLGHQTAAVAVARWLTDERLLDPVVPQVDEASGAPTLRANAR